MASISQTSRPAYVYDADTDTWIPVGIGPHTHAATDISGVVDDSLIDAKGDLIVGTAADTPSRLAAGNNGESLVADSGATSGLRWQATPSASNPVLNSSFDIWQRGTSFSLAASTSAANGFSADRWQTPTGSNQATTVSRQVTNDTTNLPFIQYCIRIQRNSGQTGTGNLGLYQSFESINSIPFAGRTVTLSFYARAGANFSASGSTLTSAIYTGTGTDQNLLLPYTGAAFPIVGSATLTTTWQRFTYSGTIAASVTELGVGFYFVPSGTASTNDWFEITGVQIDVGSVALPYRRFSATIQGELAACQRYYWRSPSGNPVICNLVMYTSTSAYGIVQFQTAMRTAPTLEQGSGTDYFTVLSNNTADTFNSIGAITDASSFSARLDITSGISVTAGQAGWLRIGNSNGYIAFSAEL